MKPRLIVLTDIGNEPDDAQSLVRLLLYANEIDIEGLAATTSTWLRTGTRRGLIDERISAYGKVLPNLRVHSAGYPDAETLARRTVSGSNFYGIPGVGQGKDTEASRLIIAAADRPDPRPLWINVWGGAADLAQALWTVRATRSPAEVDKFVAKLRVYSISDQDDAGPWARANFPKLFWIASIHAFSQYERATWRGISAALPGTDQTMVSKGWLSTNISSKGPLGALYPAPMFIMEGDTPAFLYLIPNGLGDPEHPDWGSWGGRYGQVTDLFGLWTDSYDRVRGANGVVHNDNTATIWRWRSAFQNDFAARMDWTIKPRFADANHPPELRLNGTGGHAPVVIAACPGQQIKLTTRGSRDPDGQPLTFRWWRYREPSGGRTPEVRIGSTEGPESIITMPTKLPVDPTMNAPAYQVHIMLEATDAGSPPLTRYRRAIITLPVPQPSAADAARCRAPG